MPSRTIKQEIFSSRDDALSTLAAAFPEAVTDGEVDWDALKEILADAPSTGPEKYELTWAGKAEAKREAGRDVVGRTLRFCPEESKDAETTQNLYIEGDNLEVLKLLRENYYGAVKMIYIDPPYNDGDDRIYMDSFKMSRSDSAFADGIIDETGKRMTLNPKGSNRFHANWLSLMYPRLVVARELLRQDGVIFISIDDHEIQNLRVICDAIFGPDNFEGHIHWRRRNNQPNDKTKMIGLVAEHILAYARNKTELKRVGVGKVDLTGAFSNPDNDPRGPWATKPWKTGEDQSGSRYPITSPTGRALDEEWMGEESTYSALREDNRIVFPRAGDGLPRKKYFRSEREEEGQCANNWWPCAQFGDNQKANNLVTSLFDGQKNIFSNPKPIELIRGLLQIANVKSDDIVLDFFAGSGTTVHAVFKMNAEENSSIRFICVQYPEPLDIRKEKHKPAIGFCDAHNLPYSIAEITKERLRRAANAEQNEAARNNDDTLFSKKIISAQIVDYGFKVFKTADTTIRWTHDALRSDAQKTLDEGAMSDKDRLDFMPGFTDIDVVYEIALRQNDVPLSAPVRPVPEAGKRTYLFADSILVCLEDAITPELVEALAALQPTPNKFILRDSAFEDDIALKDETLRRLQACVTRNTKYFKSTYVVNFI